MPAQPEFRTLVELLRARLAERPDHPVYTYLRDGELDEESLTHAELDRRARAIAVHLAGRGVRPGDRVLLIYDSDLHFVAGLFGCLYAGAVAVPGYPPRVTAGKGDQNLERLIAIAGDCRAKVMLTSQRVYDNVAEVLPTLPHFDAIPVLPSDPLEAGDPDPWREPDGGAGELAVLQYTSGSTGDPKGAMLSHGNLLTNMRQMEQAFRLHDRPTTVGWLPLHHDMGLIMMLLEGLANGGRVVFFSPLTFLQRPMRWMRAISRHQGNVAPSPNFGFRMVLRAVKPADLEGLELGQLRCCPNGAEPVRADTLAEFSRVFAPCGFRPEHFYPGYGMAEASVFISGWHPMTPPTVVGLDAAAFEADRLVEVDAAAEGARVLVGCGFPAEGMTVIVVDHETGERSPPDRVGELWIAGPNVAAGYWEKPEVNAAEFDAHTADGEGPYFRTGDLGFLREGMIFITGRLKDMVIIDGRNHYPQDIERTVEEAYPGLRAGGAAAFSVDDGDRERLIVVSEVGRKLDHELDVAKAARAVRGAVSVAHDVGPSEVVFLKAGGLPKTSSGKVQRRACRRRLAEGALPVVGRVTYEDEE